MTDREPGAPDDASPADETQPDPLADDAASDEGAFETTDEEPEPGDFDDDAGSEEDDESEEDEGRFDDEGDGAAAAGARPGSRITSGAGRRGTVASPGVAERAVHLDDRASAIFVLVIVATFVGIFLYGMLAGSAGFFTPLATEPPFTEQPTDTPSDVPSESPSVSPSVSVSPAVSGSPAASPSRSAGASPSGAAPSATRSAAPPSTSPAP